MLILILTGPGTWALPPSVNALWTTQAEDVCETAGPSADGVKG
jgi:hypothetical protein